MPLRIDRSGVPFIIGALVVAAITGALWGWLAASVPLVGAGFFVFFFRDPERSVPSDRNAVLSPADGRVLVAGAPIPGAVPPGEWQQISIFLSPLDVHINRAPVGGRVTNVKYAPGRFLPAYRHDAGTVNERCEIWIDHDGQLVVARQIVGLLARRVVCRVTPGSTLAAGDRYGIMKFGSRMDVFIPPTAEIRVSVGQVVRGGETVIAVLH